MKHRKALLLILTIYVIGAILSYRRLSQKGVDPTKAVLGWPYYLVTNPSLFSNSVLGAGDYLYDALRDAAKKG